MWSKCRILSYGAFVRCSIFLILLEIHKLFGYNYVCYTTPCRANLDLMLYSCFIARNLLPGLKTCKEVSSYMCGDGAVMSRGSSAMLSSSFEDAGKDDMDHTVCSLCLPLSDQQLCEIINRIF